MKTVFRMLKKNACSVGGLCLMSIASSSAYAHDLPSLPPGVLHELAHLGYVLPLVLIFGALRFRAKRSQKAKRSNR